MNKVKVEYNGGEEGKSKVDMPRHWQQAADVTVPCMTSLAVEY